MKVGRKLISIVMVFVMCITILPFLSPINVHAEETGAEDTEGPVIDLSTLEIEKCNPELNEMIKIKVKVTDASEILRVEMLYANPDNGYGSTAEYNTETGMYEFLVYTPVYGANEVVSISAKDVYGNETKYVDDTTQYSSWVSDGQPYNFSALDFMVNTDIINDYCGPDIDISSMKLSKSVVDINETTILSIKVDDPTGIMNVELQYFNADNGNGSTGVYNEQTGCYDFEMSSSVYGENEIVFVKAKDYFGNETVYVDKSSKYYSQWPFEGIDVSLSEGNFIVENQSGVEDNNVPTIDVSSLMVSKKVVGLNETTTLSVKAEDDVAILLVELLYVNADNGYGSTGVYNEQTGYYDFEMYSPVYGENEIAFIRAKDTSGNEVIYADKEIKRNNWSNWPNAIYTNLKNGQFYACVMDRETGISVSNSTMDTSTQLEISLKETNGSVYDMMHEENCETLEFYDINVEGSIDMSDEDAKVFFDMSGYTNVEEGDAVTIKHLMHDGTIQTEESVVENELIEIDVNEFSPFILEIEKNASSNSGNNSGGNSGSNSGGNSGSNSENNSGGNSGSNSENNSGGNSGSNSENNSESNSNNGINNNPAENNPTVPPAHVEEPQIPGSVNNDVSANQTNEINDVESPRTGDDSLVIVMFVLVAASFVALMFTNCRKKNRR